MTPEQRARKVCESSDGDYYCDGMGHEDDIASAIRAAEDEALERAAKTLDKANEVCGDHGGICLFCAQRRRDARMIRFLKSSRGETTGRGEP